VFHLRRARAACVTVQCAARSFAARSALQWLREEAAWRAAAATTLQATVRRRAGARCAAAVRELAHLAAVAELHQAARFVQDLVRFKQLIARRIAAANKLAGVVRTIAAVQRLARIKVAVLKLQSRLRAARMRARVYAWRPELRDICARAAKAREAGMRDPSLWLCNRQKIALDTLLKTDVLTDVLRAVSSLEMFTLIAPYVCERMVAEGAVPVLFKFFKTANSSVPSKKAVGHGLRALRNITTHPQLRAALCEQPNALSVLADLIMNNYREKANHTLLWDTLSLLTSLMCDGPSTWRQQTRARKEGNECIKRLEGVLNMLSRTALKEGGPNGRPSMGPGAKGAMGAAASRRPAPAARTAAAGRKAAPTAGKAAAAGGKAKVTGPVDLAPKCIGLLKAILAAVPQS
jgi:hypothetical protein